MPGAGLKWFVYAFCLGAGTNAASSACTEMGQGSELQTLLEMLMGKFVKRKELEKLD